MSELKNVKHVRGHKEISYRYKFENRRVIVHWCAECNEWLLRGVRLPFPEEKAEGKRLVDSGLRWSDDAMGAIMMIVGKILDEAEAKGLRPAYPYPERIENGNAGA